MRIARSALQIVTTDKKKAHASGMTPRQSSEMQARTPITQQAAANHRRNYPFARRSAFLDFFLGKEDPRRSDISRGNQPICLRQRADLATFGKLFSRPGEELPREGDER